MPKIPTFTAKGTPTAQVGAVRTNLKLSPFATAAAALVPVAQKAEEYYIKVLSVASIIFLSVVPFIPSPINGFLPCKIWPTP